MRSNNFDNQFVPARMVLPLSDADPAERISEVKTLLAIGARRAGAPPRQRHLRGDLAVRTSGSGVDPGRDVEGRRHHHLERAQDRPFPVFMAGARVDEFYAFGPLAGAAINITLFSYDGSVHLGVNSDRAAVADHELFTRCLRAAIDDTVALSPVA